LAWTGLNLVWSGLKKAEISQVFAIIFVHQLIGWCHKGVKAENPAICEKVGYAKCRKALKLGIHKLCREFLVLCQLSFLWLPYAHLLPVKKRRW
jgi:hypothetical protein